MEASQPRIKSIRAAEPSSARQSSPGTEANLLELPQRSPLGPAEAIAPVAKRQQTKRPAAKRKPMMTIRQHWVAHQQLLADEVQHLEAQAERINQRLAERSAPTATHSPVSASEPSPLADEEADRLQAQLARIRQLVADLGTAIAEGRTLEEATEPIDTAANPPSPAEIPAPEIPAPEISALETIAVSLAPAAISPAPSPSIAAPPSRQAAREAAETAATLRHLAEKARSLPHPAQFNQVQPSLELSQLELSQDFLRSLEPAPVPQRASKRQKRRLKDWLRLPQRPVDRVVDGLTWIVVAAVVRVITRILLAVFPALSPGAIVLMLAPAAIALGLTLFVPKSGYLPLYRLGLLTLGLLLGGKL